VVGKQRLITIIGLILGLSLIGAGFFGTSIKNGYFEITRPKEELPEPVSRDKIEASLIANVDAKDEASEEISKQKDRSEMKNEAASFKNKVEAKKAELNLPPSMNLDIPFTAQAPQANWDLPYQEACEEASSIMAAHFLQGRGGFNPDSANQEIVELINFEKENGYAIDTTADETAEVIRKYFGLQVEVRYDFNEMDIKKEIAQGNPVLMPFAGRQLGNPNFTPPGPLYHMMVIKGYTDNVFITNDPGTRNGSNFQYTHKKIMEANHDWNGGKVKEGRKVMMVIKK